MMGFIKFMQKRPSDKAIRIARIIFGLILISTLYYNLVFQGGEIETNFFRFEVDAAYIEYIKYGFVAIGIFPLVMGITNMCVLKKKHMRYVQGAFGILLFYISSKIVEGASLDVDSLIALMGIIPLFVGITGKGITSSCMRYKEKITKIRV